MPRTAASIAKQKATLAENKRRKEERERRRIARQPANVVGTQEGAPPVMLGIASVDWQNIGMPEAQQLYAKLKEEFERAGRILNSRLMHLEDSEFYECFMAGKPNCCAKGTKHRLPARGTDYENGFRDPKTGLVMPVRICGENCWIRFQGLLIDERRERNLVPRNS